MTARVVIGFSSVNLTDISQEQATVILSYESSQALYSYLDLHMIAFIDMNSKNQWFYHTSKATDKYTSNFYKNSSDVSNLSDDEYFSFGKTLVNTSNVADSFYRVVQYRRKFFEDTNLLDSYDKSFFKALVETPSFADVERKDTTKALANQTDSSDFYRSSFSKFKDDSFSLSDTLDTIEFFKNAKETVGFSEVETVAFAKYLFDTVTVTDDIDGAASILDDQEMNYFKFTSNISKATDNFYRVVSFVRQYTDSSDLSDIALLELGKNLKNELSMSDVTYSDIRKPLEDTSKVNDSIAIDLLLAPFLSNTTSSDLYSGELGKVLPNTTSFTDTGSLRSQGYSDFSYFAEDYVGSSRTF
jgi:hypothetical protein